MTELPPPCDILSTEWGWDNLRRDAFQLVAWGYEIVADQLRKHHLEEDITGLIRAGVNRKLDEDLPPRFQVYSVHNEDPVDDNREKHGKERPRVDILVECGGSRPRKRYRLEAKRCAESTFSIRWYATGIRAYIDMLYARFDPEAGLLGLVQSDDTKHWKSQLASKLPQDKSLAVVKSLQDIHIIPELSDMTFSIHRRVDGTEIVLYHAFLDCKNRGSDLI